MKRKRTRWNRKPVHRRHAVRPRAVRRRTIHAAPYHARKSSRVRRHYRRPAVSRGTSRRIRRLKRPAVAVRRKRGQKAILRRRIIVKRAAKQRVAKQRVAKRLPSWMRIADYVKWYKKSLPPKYRKHFSLSQSALPDQSLFVNIKSGYVSAKPRFPKKLSGNIYQYYGGWYNRSGGQPYKAEKKIVKRDKRGRKYTVKKVVTVKPEPVKRVTVERVKVGIVKKGKYSLFSPRVVMNKKVRAAMFKYITDNYAITRTSKMGSDEIFIPLALLFWEFAGV